MNAIEPPDRHFLSAAVGWLELGNIAEARAELAQISPAQKDHPDVLEVRWMVCAEQELWEEGLEAARTLLFQDPDRPSGWLHQAYASRRVKGGSVKKAWDALFPAAEKFPKEPIIPYNLACYACQMGQLDAARIWLKQATVVGGIEGIKQMAIKDPDLEPLRSEIEQM